MILQSPQGIAAAAGHLRAGGLVGMPTETVYGLAAIATDPAAIARVFAAKERPLFDPLIVHVANGDPAERLAGIVSLDGFSTSGRQTLEVLWRGFWPGPLTLVLPRTSAVPDLVTAGLDTVAVRMPRHPVAHALLVAVGIPLVAPSANRFGRISPTTAASVVAELGDRVDFVLDGGPCALGLESTIVAVDADGGLRLLRPGGVPVEALEAATGSGVGAAGPGISAPGQTPSHYAPRTPLLLVPGPIAGLSSRPGLVGRVAVLVARGDPAPAVARLRELGIDVVGAGSLAPDGDTALAARRLFALLRELDDSGAEQILAEDWGDRTGLGHAISDRLQRAAAPRPR